MQCSGFSVEKQICTQKLLGRCPETPNCNSYTQMKKRRPGYFTLPVITVSSRALFIRAIALSLVGAQTISYPQKGFTKAKKRKQT